MEVKKTRTGNLDDFLRGDFTKGDFPKGIKRKPQGNVYYTLCSKCNSFLVVSMLRNILNLQKTIKISFITIQV